MEQRKGRFLGLGKSRTSILNILKEIKMYRGNIVKRRNRYVIVIFVLTVVSNTGNIANSNQNRNISTLDSMLASLIASDRVLAAQELTKPIGFDSATAVYRLLNALKGEIDTPLSNNTISHGKTTVTEDIRYQYCRALAALSPISQDIIHSLIDSTSGEYRDRLILTLTYCGERNKHNEIINIIQNGDNPFLRLAALRTLRSHPDSVDIPLLTSALSDSFWVSEFTDPVTGYPENVFYPIRAEAATILFRLGIDTYRRGSNYEIINKK
jgi:hypothetical protein